MRLVQPVATRDSAAVSPPRQDACMERAIYTLLACAALLVRTAASPAAEAPAARWRACATLDARYQRLEARMRAGYGAREGERLWDQRRQLQAQRWALRCQDLPRGAYAAGGVARP
jgi:hypothetical protein